MGIAIIATWQLKCKSIRAIVKLKAWLQNGKEQAQVQVILTWLTRRLQISVATVTVVALLYDG